MKAVSRNNFGVGNEVVHEMRDNGVNDQSVITSPVTDIVTHPGTISDALLAGDGTGEISCRSIRDAAFRALPQVARTASHLMQFVGYLEKLRGWGRGPRVAIREWLDSFDAQQLAYQAVKYRQRGGWTLRDVLRLTHPGKIKLSNKRRVLYDWIAHRDLMDHDICAHDARVLQGKTSFATLRRHAVISQQHVIAEARNHFPMIEGYHRAQEAMSAMEVARVITEYGIPRECVPSQFLKDACVWDALLINMPMTALIRNLNRMSAVGLLVDGSVAAEYVCARLTDQEQLRKARVHPFGMLMALKVYRNGHGLLGDLTWTPAREVVAALEAGFYAAFRALEPCGKRFMLGLDVSKSMGASFLGRTMIGGRNVAVGPVSAREASAAMALVTMGVEPFCFVGGFTSNSHTHSLKEWKDGFTPLAIAPDQGLDHVIRMIGGLPFGGTDASLPIAYALEHGIEVDAFVIYTDNETWAGPEHVTEALQRYRDKMGIAARLVCVGMTATEFSVVDPRDPLQMNVVGFDAEAPAVIADFVRGI